MARIWPVTHTFARASVLVWTWSYVRLAISPLFCNRMYSSCSRLKVLRQLAVLMVCALRLLLQVQSKDQDLNCWRSSERAVVHLSMPKCGFDIFVRRRQTSLAAVWGAWYFVAIVASAYRLLVTMAVQSLIKAVNYKWWAHCLKPTKEVQHWRKPMACSKNAVSFSFQLL